MKIINNKGDIRPINREHKKIIAEYDNPIPEATSYVIGTEITGNPGERQILLSTGYKNMDEYTNTFVFSESDLNLLIHHLQGMLEECRMINTEHEIVQRAYEILYKYINMGIIESINLHKIADTYPNYSPMLYTPFRVEPKFKSIQEIEELELQDQYKDETINIGLQFIDCFHIDFNNANAMIDKLTNGNRDIPITFSNYDLNAEYKKYRDRIMKEVQGFMPQNKKEHDKQMEAKARELGLLKDKE